MTVARRPGAVQAAYTLPITPAWTVIWLVRCGQGRQADQGGHR
jgi:hypothetical protein